MDLLLPLLIFSFSLYFLIRLRFFFIRCPIKTARKMLHALKDKASRRSLCLALAGTLGVGNILGVALGVIIGGAGVVFWIFISAFFSATVKYCECTLSADLAHGREGGIYSVIRKSFPHFGKALSHIYLFLCLILSLTMGTMLQSSAVCASFCESFTVSKSAVGLVFLLISFIAIVFFAKKIDTLTEFIIPICTLLYIALCFFAIVSNIQNLPFALAKIIKGAFTVKGAAFGIFSGVNLVAVREGFARGLLSNEAGAGTSSFAQSRQKNEPHVVGLSGICEVFFDTTLLCTLTGITITVCIEYPEDYQSAMRLILDAASKSPIPFSSELLSVLVFFFALSTVICWYFYGTECVFHLSEKRAGALFKIIYLFSVYLGALTDVSSIVFIVDLSLLFMSVITLFTLKKNSERIIYLSENGGLLK
jgi:AGCS family alanine or glycine:cation symporter